jgi:hypothetical protein
MTKIMSAVSPTRESFDFQRLDGKSLIQPSKFSIPVVLKVWTENAPETTGGRGAKANEAHGA